MSLCVPPKDGDWTGIRKGFRQISRALEDYSFYNLTASRLLSTNTLGKPSTVSNLTSWVGGTTNQVTVTDDSDGTITLSGPQDLHTDATPEFGGGTFTGVVTGVLPTAGAHLATKEYVDLSLGARKSFFLSDTASGVGTLNYAYPRETGEAESTVVSGALGLGDDQLIKGFITEAGEPGTTSVNSGVVAFDFHAKKGADNQRATQLYAILSSVDADGTSNKTAIATSAVTAELEDEHNIYHIHASVAETVEIAATARLILDVYANVGAGALDSVVTLYMENAHDSHWDIEVSGGLWQNHGDILDTLNAAGKVVVEDNATTAPTKEIDGYLGVAVVAGEPRIYFQVEDNLYYVSNDGIAQAPVSGNPIGLLLTLTYA